MVTAKLSHTSNPRLTFKQRFMSEEHMARHIKDNPGYTLHEFSVDEEYILVDECETCGSTGAELCEFCDGAGCQMCGSEGCTPCQACNGRGY